MNYRNLLMKISKASLIVNKEIVWVKENNDLTGWVEFSVPLKNIGVTIVDIKQKYNKEFFSGFMINFVGELLVRTNCVMFMEEIFTIDENTFQKSSSKEIHKSFGAKLLEADHIIVFRFHMSLLQTLFTEDFKFHIHYY